MVTGWHQENEIYSWQFSLYFETSNKIKYFKTHLIYLSVVDSL